MCCNGGQRWIRLSPNCILISKTFLAIFFFLRPSEFPMRRGNGMLQMSFVELTQAMRVSLVVLDCRTSLLPFSAG